MTFAANKLKNRRLPWCARALCCKFFKNGLTSFRTSRIFWFLLNSTCLEQLSCRPAQLKLTIVIYGPWKTFELNFCQAKDHLNTGNRLIIADENIPVPWRHLYHSCSSGISIVKRRPDIKLKLINLVHMRRAFLLRRKEMILSFVLLNR